MHCLRPRKANCFSGLSITFLLLFSVGRLNAQQAIQQAAFIQPQPAVSIEVDITPEAIEARRKAASELADLDEEKKKEVDSHYAKALDNLKEIAKARADSAKNRADAETAQQRAAQMKDELEKLRSAKPAEPSTVEPSELKKQLEKIKVDLLKAQLQELQTHEGQLKPQLDELTKEKETAVVEQKTRDSRLKDIPAELTVAKQERDNLQKEIETPPPANEPMALTIARRTDRVTRRVFIDEQINRLESERDRNAAENGAGILQLAVDLSTEKVAFAEKELRPLEQMIATIQEVIAYRGVEQARLDAERIAAEPLLKEIAERNEKLAEATKELLKTGTKSDLPETLEQARLDLEKTKKRLKEVETLYADLQRKVDSVGLTNPIGALLRRERIKLPNLYKRKPDVRNRRVLIEEKQFELFRYDDDRRKLSNRDEAIDALFSKLSVEEQEEPDEEQETLEKEERRKLEEHARSLLASQAEFLDKLLPDYKEYIETLYDLDETETLLIQRTEEIENYIDQRVLWIRSNSPLYQSLNIEDADRLLVSADEWSVVLKHLVDDAGDYLLLFSLSVLLAVVLIVLRPHFRRELNAAGTVARKGTCSSIGPTLRAVWLTLLLSSLWPALTLLVGLRLTTTTATVSEFGRAVGYGLQSLAFVGLSLELLRNVCRPHGLADDHFDWPDSTIGIFRRAVPKLLVLAMPIAFLTTTLYHCDEDHGTDFPERMCFILGTIVLSMFLRRTLRPDSGVLCEYLSGNRGGWLDRLTPLWYWGGVLSPLVLGGLAAVGFYYTAYQLAGRLFVTILFLVTVQLVRAFLQRLLIVQRRRIRLDQLRQKREEAAARAADEHADEAPAAGTPLASVPLDGLKADVEASTEQSRRLVTTALFMISLVGTWMIWVDVLPALRFLDRWPLWTTMIKASEADQVAGPGRLQSNATPVTGESSVSGSVPDEVEHGVTVIHLSVAILIAILTIAAARNVPGLMELWVLQKLPLDQSIRYAIRSLTSYAIVLIGIILAFKAIYVGWSQVQWLATALTFGLAFGLQEIFANFVAGLILLFERPIRVGDVVTVDDVSGVVSRIRIRATTITNWDRKEYVIPNKEFITGRMLNWTLSDKVNRIVINVGIAYGSDTERARALLLQICHEHPLLLSDPPPIVTFEGFGDNTLNLVVRTYLPDLENRLVTIHELHTRINDEFNRAGIEIAFPQRDLHIRSIDPLAAQRLRGESSSG